MNLEKIVNAIVDEDELGFVFMYTMAVNAGADEQELQLQIATELESRGIKIDLEQS